MIKKLTFDSLFEEYIDLYTDGQSESEIINKKSRYRKHIEPTIGNMDIHDIKLKHCQEIVNNMIKVKELSPKTAKNVKVVIQTVYAYAIKNDYVEKNPALYVKIPKFDNKYNISIQKNQIKSLINHIITWDDFQHRGIFTLALHGRRKNEILKMQWYQVDLSLKTYSIPAQKNKSRKHDVHKMTNLLHSQLEKQYKYVHDMKGKVLGSDYVFINPKTDYHFKDIRRQFDRLKKRCEIDSMRFHDFRHLLVTESIKKGLNIEHVSQALGHSSIEVTQRYLTKDSEISQNVVNEYLNEYIPIHLHPNNKTEEIPL